uniref:GPN-loop GTPase 3 n=1 Tax=Rhipicephalus pulchellus TaxID=72859 RepID=L7M860_RHIPC
MRYAQLVMGPAGSGKSTYCSTIAKHCEAVGRTVHVVNLDPAAEYFDYNVAFDVRSLIQVDDVMEDEELAFGPNGALVFCFEYLSENVEWLEEQLGEDSDDYFIFDCPGQIELYTHLDVMTRLVRTLEAWEFRVCGVFLIDSQFLVDTSKFFSGVLSALAAMVNFEIPHVNVITKMDLLNRAGRRKIGRFLEPDSSLLLEDDRLGERHSRLSEAIAKVVEEYSLVKFMPLNIKVEESIGDLLLVIDNAIQYGEDLDVKTHDFDHPDRDDDGDVPYGLED